MLKSLKLKVLITIVLLSCSTNLLGSNVIDNKDSVKVAYSDLRIVNSKLVELEYTKQINNKYKTIISNDSIAINSYKTINDNLTKQAKRYKVQRNIGIVTTIAAIVGLIVSFAK